MSHDTFTTSAPTETLSFLDLLTENRQDLIARAAQSSYQWLLEVDTPQSSQHFWMPTYFQQISAAPRQAAATLRHFSNLSETYADTPDEAALLKSAPERIFALAFMYKAMIMDNSDYNMTCDGQKNMHDLLQTIRDTAHTILMRNVNRPIAEVTDTLCELGNYAAAQGYHYMQLLNARPV